MIKNLEMIKQARAEIWEEYKTKERKEERRKEEVKNCIMEYKGVKMVYGMQVIGQPDENGYPLYIALHGGGYDITKDLNDQQWNHMYIYYRNSVENGIYINPRGVRDTWDCHSNEESFPLYDRLIENMILFHNVDPNRVYFLGFSAGGDGVYMIAPKMPDRMAATHMSAGHHNGKSVTNLYNLPIQLQVGMQDKEYNRNKVTVEYDWKLDHLNRIYGGGYEHNLYVHADKGHNFFDNSKELQPVIEEPDIWYENGTYKTKMVDANAIHFLDGYQREALPKRVVWDLSSRADSRMVESFYWLSAPKSVKEGILFAEYDTGLNMITIIKDTTDGNFSILLEEEMVDCFKPVIIKSNKGVVKLSLELSIDLLRETTKERGDKNYQFIAKIDYNILWLK